MSVKYISKFSSDNFNFYGAYVVASHCGFNLLISPQGTSIILSDALLKQLDEQKLSSDFKFKLIQHYFADIGNKSYQLVSNTNIIPTYFIIDLTKACNLNCIYCFRDEKQVDTITIEALHKNLEYIKDFYVKNNLRHITVQPWGGEPLITFDLIEYMHNFFKQQNMNATIELETNGTLINDSIAQKMKDLNISVGVSIDGNEELHNRQRKYVNGNGTYSQVKSGINALKKYYKNRIGTISVITKLTISHIEDIIGDFVGNLELKYFKFNIVRENPFSREENICPTLTEISTFYRKIFELVCANVGTKGEFIEDTIRSRLANVLLSTKKNCCNSRGCTGGKSIISIDKNGDIFPCEMTDFENEKIGNITESDLLMQINNAQKKNDYFKIKHSDKCESCPWWVYCKGGCSSRVKYLNRAGQIDEIECCINETLYPLICNLILENQDLAYKTLNL